MSVRKGLIVACVLSAGLLVHVRSAEAQEPGPDYFGPSRLVNADWTGRKESRAGQCVDVFENSKAVGTHAVMFDCHNRPNQQFSLLDESYDSTRIAVYEGGNQRCLNYGRDTEAVVFIDRCDRAPYWRVEEARISPVNDPDACLAVHPDFEDVVARRCVYNDLTFFGSNWYTSQMWHLGGPRTIVNVGNSNCVDVKRGSKQPGSSMVTYQCTGAEWQSFQFLRNRYMPSRAVLISVYQDGQRLCLANSSQWKFDALDAVVCNPVDTRQWFETQQPFEGAGMTTTLVSMHTGRCMDAYANGYVGMWQCHGRANQKWRL